MRIPVADPSLVLLVGASGSGKSSFAERAFRPTEVVSSDACRALIADDAADQSATEGAFAVLHAIVGERLRNLRLAVVDATNVQPRARRALLDLARHHDLPASAIVFDPPVDVGERRAGARANRPVAPEVVRRQHEQLHKSLASIEREGFRDVAYVRSDAELSSAQVAREPLAVDRRTDRGPFDVIGDVHGCHDELEALLARLGYAVDGGSWRHPAGRRVVFVGDLVDRGPRVVEVLRAAMAMVRDERALVVPGNHDDKLARKLRGRNVKVAHGLQQSLDALAAAGETFRGEVADFLESLPSHLVLDEGRLVVAHAGMREELQGRDSRRVRDFALYGQTTGELDEYGLPVRLDWAARYCGAATVVYGHTPVSHPEWHNRTLDIDTGCVFGGALTALRYPELELVSLPARATYAESARPFLPSHPEAPARVRPPSGARTVA